MSSRIWTLVKMFVTNVFTHRNLKDGFTEHELRNSMKGLRILCKKTNVFPTPDQELWLGDKLQLMDKLSEIALTVTKTPFPKYFEVKDPSKESILGRNNLYIKRNYSDRRMWIPSQGCYDSGLKERLRKWVEETNGAYDRQYVRELGVEARWIGMACMESMKTAGWVRVYFVGGRRRKMIWTREKEGGLSMSQDPGDGAGIEFFR